ncbi:MAG: L-threonylcarbamoyladenylate synthase [Limnobacter sp.]|nr:L-threonylcarbamoyladenylate synthase [Limnobacter sp.]
MMTTNLTAHLNTELLPADEASITRAAQALNEGALVAFPTETVFGLGAIVTNESALQAVFQAKGRPADHPLIAHISKVLASKRGIQPWVMVDDRAVALIEAFWPGPLTLVLPIGPRMSRTVSGGQDSVGIRCPSHPVAQALLSLVNAPVAAPSANRFGKVSPTSAAHVMEELGGRIPYVLDGAIPEIGIESTILSLLDTQPVLLRPGHITPEQIEAVIHQKVLRPSQLPPQSSADESVPRVSGSLEKHYSPDAKLLVVEPEWFKSLEAMQSAHTLIVGWTLPFLQAADAFLGKNGVDIMALEDDSQAVAKVLYGILRKADEKGYNRIVMELPAHKPEWEGVADRLKRASA